ncbi:hypothetical protein LG293_17840 (plasmid) [Citricoccus nitrophenolicus]
MPKSRIAHAKPFSLGDQILVALRPEVAEAVSRRDLTRPMAVAARPGGELTMASPHWSQDCTP